VADNDAAVRAGHISFEQAEGIAGRSGKAPVRGPRAAEVLGYFGAVALAVATVVLAFDVGFGDFELTDILFNNFDNVPAGAIALAGAAILLFLGTRFADNKAGAIHRAGSFTLLAGFGLASLAFNFLLTDLDLDDFTPLVRVLPVAAVALYIWFRSPSVPTQLALFGTAIQVLTAFLVLVQAQEALDPADIAVALGLGATPDTGGWYVLVAHVALGLGWLWLGSEGRLRSRNTAFLLGATYAWFGSLQLFSTADSWILLSTFLAIVFAWGAARWQSSVLGAVATAAVIVLVAQFVAALVDEPTTMTWVIAYGVPGVLALLGAWILSGPGGTTTSAMPMPPPAPVPAMAMAAAATKPTAPRAPAATATATRRAATTTAKKPTAAKKPAAKKPAAKKPAAKKKTTR
jgi:hypothetical protein